jgi:hypothetical protein
MIEVSHPDMSVRRQCELIGLNRSTLYYQPATESELNLRLMRCLCLAFVLTGSQSREAIAAGVSQWSAVRSIGEARRADTPVCRVSDAAWFFLRPSTRSRARLLPAASSTLNTYDAID